MSTLRGTPQAGANTTLRDAYHLAHYLTRAAYSEMPLTEAIAAYETEMTRYAYPIVRASAKNGQLLAGQDPLPEPYDSHSTERSTPPLALDAHRINSLNE